MEPGFGVVILPRQAQVQRDLDAVPVRVLVRRLGAERPGIPAPDGAPGGVEQGAAGHAA
jgi:hypothetical protein